MRRFGVRGRMALHGAREVVGIWFYYRWLLRFRTFESFCTYLVRARPWLSALGGLPAIADDTREHYEAAAQATLDMADEDESVEALIAHLDVDVRAARGLLAVMLGSRDQWLPLLGEGRCVDQLLRSMINAI